MTETAWLEAAYAEMRAYLHEIGGCGDGYCIIERPKGQHTNGGCRCSSDRYKMQRFAYAHNRFADAIHAHVASLPSTPNVG